MPFLLVQRNAGHKSAPQNGERRKPNETEKADHMEIWMGTDAFESRMVGMVL